MAQRNAHETEEDKWYYNLIDCIRTRQVGEAEQANIKTMGLVEVDAFQQKLLWPVLKAMNQGVRIDLAARKALKTELAEALRERQSWIEEVLGHPFNISSPLQMKSLLYTDLGITPIMSRATKNSPKHVTCNEEALLKIMKKEPLMKPLIEVILDCRTIGVFLHTFVEMELDVDDRMRCSYNICGTETFRFSSSENAFGSGGNLQNLPKEVEAQPGRKPLPSIKKLFIPDEGMTFFDMDLDRADLQVVAWEADEQPLKDALKLGVDLHLMNAFALLDKDVALGDIIEGTESCAELKNRYGKERAMAKQWCHGTNYGGSARTMAIQAGITIAQSEKNQKNYFARYPGIKKWQDRVLNQLVKEKCVRNILGYRRYYFSGGVELLPEALAWIPQSTVACVINRAWVAIHEHPESRIEVLLQVHDSLAGQFPTAMTETCLETLLSLSRIVLPYEDELIIPVGVKTSTKSWGEVE